jgi:hypothetical protein
MDISNRITGWSTSNSFELQEGLYLLCSCIIQRRGLDLAFTLESRHYFHSWHPEARLISAFDLPQPESLLSRDYYTDLARKEREVVYVHTAGRNEDTARVQRLFIDAENICSKICGHRKNVRPLFPLTFLSLQSYTDHVVRLWASGQRIAPDDFMRCTLHLFYQPPPPLPLNLGI